MGRVRVRGPNGHSLSLGAWPRDPPRARPLTLIRNCRAIRVSTCPSRPR